MLLTVEGTYQNGQIYLHDAVSFDTEKKVIVTFLADAPSPAATTRLKASNFSFQKTQEALKTYTGSFSEDVIKERRESI